MKTTTLFTSFIATGLLAAAPAFAGQWEGNLDMQGSILNDLDKPTFVGTGMAVAKPSVNIYGAFAGPDIDASGFAVGSAGREKGHGDTYGWVVHDVGL